MTFEYACKSMLWRDPFWGLFLAGLNKRKTKNVPTLGVYKEGNGVAIDINMDFWNTLKDEEQYAVLLHELHHIAFGHIFYGPKLFPDHYRSNIAMDAEVNSYINNLPDGCVKARDFGLDERQGTKYYYDNLPKNICTTYIKIGGDGLPQTLDDHGQWKSFDSLSDAEKEIVKQAVDQGLVEAAKQCEKMRGTVPSELSLILDDLLKEKPRIYDWKAHFRRKLGSAIDTKLKKTYQRESKRFSYSPGIKFRKKVKILVGIDTSGSVSDTELADFFSEINHIYKTGASIHVIECDAAINNEWDYRGLHNIKITGRGGTDFKPMVDYYRNHLRDYTCFALFTDGYAPVEGLNVPRNDMLWIITSGGEHKDYPGKTIYIPGNNN